MSSTPTFIIDSEKSLVQAIEWRAQARSRVGEILVEAGVVPADAVSAALLAKSVAPKGRLGDILVAMGWLTAEQLNEALARQSGRLFVDVSKFEPDAALVQSFPAIAAWQFKCLPLVTHGASIVVATLTEPSPDELAALRFAANKKVIAFCALEPNVLEVCLARHFPDVRATRLVHRVKRVEEHANHEASQDDSSTSGKLTRYLSAAVLRRASDLHFRPMGDSLSVSLRVDGVLRQIDVLDGAQSLEMTRHVQLLAGVDPFTTEARKKDRNEGRVCVSVHERSIDLRVSAIATASGTSIVLRVLDPQRFPAGISELPIPLPHKNRLKELVNAPHGLFLTVGPTGSGKTTTLYTLAKELARQGMHVVTLEDPVEYRLEGLNQIETQDFAKTTASVLRHDPDALLIGEIRDAETAAAAVNAALTGHLVLASLHAADGRGAIQRLLGLGVAVPVLESCLSGIAAQRLVRSLCGSCGGSGCGECAGTGFHGRTLVMELSAIKNGCLPADASMLSSAAIESALKYIGGQNLDELLDALVEQGTTTAAELAQHRSRR